MGAGNGRAILAPHFTKISKIAYFLGRFDIEVKIFASISNNLSFMSYLITSVEIRINAGRFDLSEFELLVSHVATNDDAGKLLVKVGLAAMRSAEFIILELSQQIAPT